MSNWLADIRCALPSGLPPEIREDIAQEVAVLVLEGRIEQTNLAVGIKRFEPMLRKKYRLGPSRWTQLSLDKPLRDDSSATLADVISEPGSLPKQGCPQCRGDVKAGLTFCSRTCSLRYHRRRVRRIDPEELKDLHLVRWLPRKTIAAALGVKIGGLNSTIQRNGLGRLRCPATCRIAGCGQPTKFVRHVSGHMAGNFCAEHKREKQREYQRRSRRKRVVPTTPQQRSESARKATLARWSKMQSPEERSAFGRRVARARWNKAQANA